jgi:uncharacterized protein
MNLLALLIPLALLIATAVIILVVDMGRIEINRYRVPAGKDRIREKLIIAQISDLHVSPWQGPSIVRKVVKIVNKLNPDYVVITGDFITHYRELIPGCARALQDLKPKFLTLAVLGNHDYWTDPQYVAGTIEEAGIKMLANANVSSCSGQPVTIVGVDDPFTGHDDLAAAIKGAPEQDYKILLSHSPDIIKKAAIAGIDLMLSGHTHGGQVCLPIIGAIYVPSDFGVKYARGWFPEGKMRMYVNRGVGEIYPNVRFFCRREIAIFEIVPEDGEPKLVERKIVKL